jgi:hypothetical protein
MQSFRAVLSAWGGGVVVQKIWSHSNFSFWCFMVSNSFGVGRFVLMVMAVERGDATGALGLFQILVSYSQFCYVIFRVS